MNYSLTELDIKKYLGNECRIINYKQLNDIRSLDTYMKPFKYLIILYTWKENYGHWTCVLKNDLTHTFEFFDSYGTKPDYQLMDVPIRIRNDLGMEYPQLASLLYKSPRQILYNEDKLQKFSPRINTCGKWVVLRCCMGNIPVETFAKLFEGKRHDSYLQQLWRNFTRYYKIYKN